MYADWKRATIFKLFVEDVWISDTKTTKSPFSNWFLLRFLIRCCRDDCHLTNTRAEPLAPSDCETSIVESHWFQGCHGGHCGRSKSEWQCVAVSWWIFSFWKTIWESKRFAGFFCFFSNLGSGGKLYNSHELVCDGPFCWSTIPRFELLLVFQAPFQKGLSSLNKTPDHRIFRENPQPFHQLWSSYLYIHHATSHVLSGGYYPDIICVTQVHLRRCLLLHVGGGSQDGTC